MNGIRWLRICWGILSWPPRAPRVGGPFLGIFLVAGNYVTAACAELITFQFSGTVTSVTVRKSSLQAFAFPNVGDRFAGFYTFDSNSFRNSPNGTSGVTILPDRAVGVTIGGFEFEGAAIVIGISQNSYTVSDWIPLIELTSNPALAAILDRNRFELVVRKQNLFPDPNTLPLTPPSLVGAEARSLVMYMDSRFNTLPAPYVTIVAGLDSLTVVPEPSTLLLMGITLIFFPMRTGRRPN